MAARGCVHSARAIPRVLNRNSDKATGKVATKFSSPHRHIQQRACRLLTSISQSQTRADHRLFAVRSMATGLPSTATDGQTASKLPTEEPRQQSSYEEAIQMLNSLQSNAETIRKSMNDRMELRKLNIPNMVKYLRRVGLSLEDVDRLSVIHVTGTKGKGSTCAFTESILRHYGYKTGLFSSPHLIEVRERIRINGRPIDPELFSKSFWDVFNKLQATRDEREDSMPHYFSFLTVMALYVFAQQGVGVAVLEVGIGGQYDSTNVVQSPVVCGVSSLDFDHTNLLGHTLEEIAWHKAGIFKTGSEAVTVTQPDSALQVILNRSLENQCPLSVAAPLTQEELSPSQDLQLGIAGRKQVYNAGLAVQLCQTWLRARGRGEGVRGRGEGTPSPERVDRVQDIPVRHCTDLSPEMVKGLCECQWPGRTQVVRTPGVTYYLDGAHTADSMQQCVEWFKETADREKKLVRAKVRRVLVFNVTGDRPVPFLLQKLRDCDFDMAAFCPNVVSTMASKNIPDQFNNTVEQETALKNSHSNRQTWDSLFAPQTTSTSNQSTYKAGNSSNRQSPHVDDSSKDRSGTNGHSQSSVDASHSGVSQQCESDNFPCVASALQWATDGQAADVAAGRGVKENEDHVQVLVTGSLHLVGGVLKLLTPHMND